MRKLLILLMALALCCGAAIAQEYDELSGAWRTGEDADSEAVLLLYPGYAFRMHEINAQDGTTQMLEGTRGIEGESIIVTDVRLGRLDYDGNYELIEYADDDVVYTFALDTDGVEPTLTLTDAQGRILVLYAFDMDSPE